MKRYGFWGFGLSILVTMMVTGCELEKPFNCRPGETRCNNMEAGQTTCGVFQICSSYGEWGSEVVCVNGCSDNSECLDDNYAPCDGHEGEIICVSDDQPIMALHCINKQWIPQVCDSGVCATGRGCEKPKSDSAPQDTNYCKSISESLPSQDTTYSVRATYTADTGVWSLAACLAGNACDGKSCQIDEWNSCGKSGINCVKSNTGVKTAECENRACIITSCEDTFYLDKETNSCQPNSDEKCGAESGKNSLIDCTIPGNIGYNRFNKCDSTGRYCICSGEEYLTCDGDDYEGKCINIKEDIENCGSCGNDCKEKLEGAEQLQCYKGVCLADSCKTSEGYHIHRANKCAEDDENCVEVTDCEINSNSHCGSSDKACSIEDVEHSTDLACELRIIDDNVESRCVPKACDEDYHLYNDTCEPDSDEHCGGRGIACTLSNPNMPGLESYTCQKGQCTLTCIDGYMIVGNECRKKECDVKDQITCSEGKLFKCVDPPTLSEEGPCPDNHSCKNGTECGECHTGDTSCSNSQGIGQKKVCVNGMWSTPESCGTVSCNSAKTDCGECKDSDTKCSNTNKIGQVQTCSDGKWQPANSCSAVSCKGKGCGDCKNDDKQCDSSKKNVQTCQAGKWENTNSCTTSVTGAVSACDPSTLTCKTECGSGYKDCRSPYLVLPFACTNISSSTDNCGDCGKTCDTSIDENAKSVECSSGSCRITACNSGYHILTLCFLGTCTDSCQKDSKSNCGAPGNKCGTGESCCAFCRMSTIGIGNITYICGDHSCMTTPTGTVAVNYSCTDN